MRRVASMPSTPGMRTSISTTSGDEASTSRDRLGAVLGLADDLDVVAGVEDHAEPRPHQRLIVGDDDPDASRHRRPGAGGRARGSRRAPSARPRTCRRAARPARASRSARSPARRPPARCGPSVVDNVDLDRVGASSGTSPRRASPGRGAACSSAPPGRCGTPRGRPRRATRQAPSRMTTTSRPGGPQRLGQLVEPVQPRLRRRRRADRVRANGAEQPAQLAQRFAPGVLDRPQRGPRLVGAGVEHVAGRAGLHDDHRRRCGRSRRATRGRCAPARRQPPAAPPPGLRRAGCGPPRRAPTR